MINDDGDGDDDDDDDDADDDDDNDDDDDDDDDDFHCLRPGPGGTVDSLKPITGLNFLVDA